MAVLDVKSLIILLESFEYCRYNASLMVYCCLVYGNEKDFRLWLCLAGETKIHGLIAWVTFVQNWNALLHQVLKP